MAEEQSRGGVSCAQGAEHPDSAELCSAQTQNCLERCSGGLGQPILALFCAENGPLRALRQNPCSKHLQHLTPEPEHIYLFFL